MTVAAAVAAILCTVPIAVAAPNTGEGLSPSATGAAAGQPWRQVRKGEGLMSISRGVAASHDVSLAQAMVGLYRANPDAFMGGDMGRLAVGTRLRVPDRDYLRATSHEDAVREVSDRLGIWGASPKASARALPAAAMQPSAPLATNATAVVVAAATSAAAATPAPATPTISAPAVSAPAYTPVLPADALLLPRQPSDAFAPGAFGVGAVSRIVVEADRNGVPADGQSAVEFVVRLFDTDGKPVSNGYATLEHSAGRLLLPGARTDEAGPRGRDADRATPGVQLPITDGIARFKLLAPAEAQDVMVRVTAGGRQASGIVTFVPEMRDMIAAGLVEGIVDFRDKALVGGSRNGDGFERQLDAWSRSWNDGKANAAARAAFYMKGTIGDDLLLTAAYDSDKDTRQRLLRDYSPDEMYPIYGDSSLRSFDAVSGSKVYVRVDKDRSYAMFGDFVTGDGFSQPLGQGGVASLKQRSLGAWNRTATGARLHHEQGNLTANLYVFEDSLRSVIEEFASQGSGPYALRNNEVLEGSEKVEVVVRDRDQTSRIISVRPLSRLVDYVFEPFSGRILLTQFLPAFDADLNPVSLRVSYEVDQGGNDFWAGGADAQWRISDAFEIGGSYVDDRNPLAPYELRSVNATWRMGERTALVVEYADSTSTVNTNSANQAVTPGLAGSVGEVQGEALRAEFAHQGERTEARVAYGRSDPAFNNTAAPLSGGREEFFAQAAVRLGEPVQLYADGWRSEDRNTGGGERQSAGVGLMWDLTKALRFDLGVRRHEEVVGAQGNGFLTVPFGMGGGLTGSIASGSAGGALGFGAQVLDPATGLPVIVQGGLPPAVSTLPAGTRLESDTVRLGASWRIAEPFRIGAEYETDINGDDRRRAAIGADWQFLPRTRLYGRYEQQDGWVQMAGVTDTARDASAFAFGVESTWIRDTQLFSEYRLRDAVSGRDLQLASGIQHAWDLREGLRLSAGYEQIDVLSGETAKSNAAAFGIDWTSAALWRASTRVEFRQSGDIGSTPDDDSLDTVLWQATIARKLDRDWTLLARNYLLQTKYDRGGEVFQDRAQLGLAYRDTDTNRVNALAKVEYKVEEDSSNALLGDLSSRAWIASAHADWHPSRPWWITGRVAGKWQKDRFENGVRDEFRAQLVSGRVVYDLTEDWDVGLLAAGQFGQRGAVQKAFGVEVGRLLRQNLWLSVGANLTGFDGDRDLAGYEYTREGVYIRLRFKFDEHLFKGSDREINRSLDR
jgi:FimV-like protein